MTLTPDAEARIDDRIRRLSRRGRDEAGRAELRDHVAQAAEAFAGKDLVTPRHVDAAFASLGSDDDVRAAFFPRRAPPQVHRWEVAALTLATLLAAGAIVGAGGGTATCSVSDGGTCTASTSGDVLDFIVWAGSPLAILGLLYFLPAVVAFGAAVVYTVVATLRTVSEATFAGAPSLDVLLVLAGLITFAVCGLHLRVELRGRADAAHS